MNSGYGHRVSGLSEPYHYFQCGARALVGKRAELPERTAAG